jgi:hypothetical protein
MMSCQEFEQLIETLELFSDRKAVKRIKQDRVALKKGIKLLSHEEVFDLPRLPKRS